MAQVNGQFQDLGLPWPRFGGEQGENPEPWLFKMEASFAIRGMTPQQKVDVIGIVLEKGALNWYQAQSIGGQHFDSFETFANEFRLRFNPQNQPADMRRKLRQLKQTGRVDQYIPEYQTYVNRAGRMQEADKVSYFAEGLTPRLKSEVIYRDPDNIKEAIEIARRYEAALQTRDMVGFNSEERTHRQNYASRQQAEMPMELGYRNSNDGRCFKCNKKGHIAKFCRPYRGRGRGRPSRGSNGDKHTIGGMSQQTESP